MNEEDEFDRFAKRRIKEGRKYLAVCRNTYTGELFYIQFKTKKQLERFILDNSGDTDEIGFYAKAYVNGKFYDENT